MITAEDYATRVIDALKDAIVENETHPLDQLNAVCQAWADVQFQAERELSTCH